MAAHMTSSERASKRGKPIGEAAWACLLISIISGLPAIGIVCSGGNGLLATVFGVAWFAFLCAFGIMADSGSTTKAGPDDAGAASAAVLVAGASMASSSDCGSAACH